MPAKAPEIEWAWGDRLVTAKFLGITVMGKDLEDASFWFDVRGRKLVILTTKEPTGSLVEAVIATLPNGVDSYDSDCWPGADEPKETYIGRTASIDNYRRLEESMLNFLDLEQDILKKPRILTNRVFV